MQQIQCHVRRCSEVNLQLANGMGHYLETGWVTFVDDDDGSQLFACPRHVPDLKPVPAIDFPSVTRAGDYPLST